MTKATILGAITWLLLGCSSGDDFSACSENETQECACPGGAMGAQSCNADGSGWSKCQCGGGGSGGGAGTASVGGAAGLGGAALKECTTDKDCLSQEKPYCIDFICVYRLAPDESCDPNGTYCAPGYSCTRCGEGSWSDCVDGGHDVGPQCKQDQ